MTRTPGDWPRWEQGVAADVWTEVTVVQGARHVCPCCRHTARPSSCSPGSSCPPRKVAPVHGSPCGACVLANNGNKLQWLLMKNELMVWIPATGGSSLSS